MSGEIINGLELAKKRIEEKDLLTEQIFLILSLGFEYENRILEAEFNYKMTSEEYKRCLIKIHMLAEKTAEEHYMKKNASANSF